MKHFLLAVSLLSLGLLSACAIARPTYLQDGSAGYHISCDGAGMSMSDCIQKAGDICQNRGYKIYGESGEAVPYSSVQAGENKHGSSVNATSSEIITRDMLIRCN